MAVLCVCQTPFRAWGQACTTDGSRVQASSAASRPCRRTTQHRSLAMSTTSLMSSATSSDPRTLMRWVQVAREHSYCLACQQEGGARWKAGLPSFLTFSHSTASTHSLTLHIPCSSATFWATQTRLVSRALFGNVRLCHAGAIAGGIGHGSCCPTALPPRPAC